MRFGARVGVRTKTLEFESSRPAPLLPGRTADAESGKASAGCLIWVAVAIVVVAVASYGVVRFGIELIEDEVRRDLAGNPVLLEHLGEIQDLSLDFTASRELPGENDFAFEIRGAKASGVLRATVLTGDDELEHVTAGTITLANGDEYDLFPGIGDDLLLEVEDAVPSDE